MKDDLKITEPDYVVVLSLEDGTVNDDLKICVKFTPLLPFGTNSQ